MPPSDVVQATPSPLKVVQKSDKECNNAQENGEEKGLSNTAVNGHEHQHQPKQLNKEADALPHQQNNLLRGKEELKKVYVQSLKKNIPHYLQFDLGKAEAVNPKTKRIVEESR